MIEKKCACPEVRSLRTVCSECGGIPRGKDRLGYFGNLSLPIKDVQGCEDLADLEKVIDAHLYTLRLSIMDVITTDETRFSQ